VDKETRRRRFNIAIKVMQRVARSPEHRFNLDYWQDDFYFGDVLRHTENDAVGCKTACCFSGWLALSQEASAEGASVSSGGSLKMNNQSGVEGMQEFLGIRYGEARELVLPTYYRCKPNAFDVLHKLYTLMDRYRLNEEPS
jgi:hypothetical protein